ncbi:MAG: Shedu immune nuclease family protein [Gallionella sp.]
MATLPPESPFDPVLEIEDGTLDGKPCVHAYYVAVSEASFEANDPGLGAMRDKVLLATVTEDALRMFPINVRRGKADYLQPRHDNLRTITIAFDDDEWPLPEEPDDFAELLLGLPTGFSKQFQYGLGLKWEYRFLVNAISNIPGITELVISKGTETTVAPPTYRLGVKSFEQLRRAIDTIARRYQREALEDKSLLAYTSLLQAALPSDFPLRTKKIRPGAIYELVKIGGERSNLSRSDRQAAMSIITKDKEEIAKTDSNTMLALRSEIEKVTLGILIQKFEEMLTKDLNEKKWENFFKNNPFVLSLAFAYPVFLVQNQAYVGGATIYGAGEKIADFLLAQRYTGNLALIEIKCPRTPLLRVVEYRTDLHAPTREVSGSISQVLDQKYRLQTSFTQKAYESGLTDVHPYSIQCIVIVGTSPAQRDEKKSLELLRNSTKDVTIVTFDELLEKLKEIKRVFSAADDSAPKPTDADVPF